MPHLLLMCKHVQLAQHCSRQAVLTQGLCPTLVIVKS